MENPGGVLERAGVLGGSGKDGDLKHIPRRELVVLILVACLLACATSWPLITRLSHDVAVDLGDPLLQAWQVAWGGHALTNQPSDFFDSNAFWPENNSLAFSDALLGYAPAGLLGSGATSALVRYNLLFLFAYALAFMGAYLLARQLGLGVLAAAVAGVAFAYAPWRLSQNGHLHVISSGGIPLSLFCMVRGYQQQRPWVILAGWGIAAWQLAVGFTLGLQLAYLLAILGLLGVIVWIRRGRQPLPRHVLKATFIGMLLFGIWSVVQTAPYLEVAEQHPGARRGLEEVRVFSVPLKGLLAAPDNSLLWSAPTESVRRKLIWPTEQTLFPGVTAPLLAVIGLFSARSLPGRLRFGLGLAIFICTLLSLGLTPRLSDGRFTYRLLYEYAPGWQSIRTPGRLNTLTSLAIALLAAGGAQEIVCRVSSANRRLHQLVTTAGVGLVGLVLLEGLGPLPHPSVPPPPEAQEEAPAPQLHLPFFEDSLYMYWSTDGFPEIVNGYSGFFPPRLERLWDDMRGFPDNQTVDLLRSMGVESVVLHKDLAKDTSWATTDDRAITDLGLERREEERIVIYLLRPDRRAGDNGP